METRMQFPKYSSSKVQIALVVEQEQLNTSSSTINTNQRRLYDVYLNALPYNTNNETFLFGDNNLSLLNAVHKYIISSTLNKT